jgi:hypothetical protein
MLQRILDDIATLVKALTAGALQFTESRAIRDAA